MERKKLTPGEVEALVGDAEDRGLLRWYEGWKGNRIGYALAQPLLKLPLLLLVWIVVQWRTGVQQFLSEPTTYAMQRLPGIFVLYVVLALGYYAAWRQKAFDYTMRARLQPSWPQPEDDGQVARTARAVARRTERLYPQWGIRSWKLTLVFGLVTPILGLLPLLLISAFRDGRFHWQDFVDSFEGGYALMAAVAGIFVLFGAWLGYSIYKQLRHNHQLLSSTQTRER